MREGAGGPGPDLGVLPGPPAGWRCLSGNSSAATMLLVGIASYPHLWAGPQGDTAHVVPCAVHVVGADAPTVPSPLLPAWPHAHGLDRAEHPTHGWLGAGKAGCSQHHLEKASCWMLLLFIYCSLVIINELKAQPVAFSLAIELPRCS